MTTYEQLCLDMVAQAMSVCVVCMSRHLECRSDFTCAETYELYCIAAWSPSFGTAIVGFLGAMPAGIQLSLQLL